MHGLSNGVDIGERRDSTDCVGTRKLRADPLFPDVAFLGLLESIEASEPSGKHCENALDHGLGRDPGFGSRVLDPFDMGKDPESLAYVSEDSTENG